MKKFKLAKKIYNYTAVFEADKKSGGFTVTVPALPGCISEGDTFEEAAKNINEAASLYLEFLAGKHTKALPESTEFIVAPITVAV